MKPIFSFCDCTIRVDKIVFLGKVVEDGKPSIRIRLKGCDEIFIMPYVKQENRDEDYEYIRNMMREQ